MPILILFVGILLIGAGINNKIPELGALIKEDFRPTNGGPGFHVWIVAIFGVGAIGYIPSMKPFANAFLTLIIVGLLLSNKGFVEKFTRSLGGLK